MGLWTLKYAGTEKSFADWGLAHETAELTTSHMAIDLFTVAMPGVAIDSDVESIFAFEGLVTIYSNRAFGGGVFSGGTIEFQGKRMLAILDGRPEYEGVIFQFGNAWYDIEQTPYQQTRYSYVGPGTTTYLVSEVVLFQKVTGPGTSSVRTSGQQISDILQHLLDQYTVAGMAAPYQIGTIDPALNLPTYQARDVKCSEAIEMCLKLSPDAVVYFDYTFTPPKIHVRNRGNLAVANVGFADGVQFESLNLTPRYDLQAQSVVLYFNFTNSVNGITFLQTVQQKYPALGLDGGLRVVVQTIDLVGWAATVVAGTLVCTAIANTRTWWQKYIPELQSSKITTFSVGAMSAVDESGTAINLATYPNVLDDGSSIASWMKLGGGAPITGVRATITVTAAYVQEDDQRRPVQVFSKKELVARVTLTNGITGNYTTVTSAFQGEAMPTGLAQAVYLSLATLQYDGAVTLVQREISGAPGMGNALNLTGGRTEWTTMAALIQSVRKQYGVGRTTVTVGPARHLSAGDLTQLFLFNRFRWVRVNPSSQATAQLATTGNVTLGDNTAKENTQAGLEEANLQMLAAAVPASTNADVVKSDAGGKSIFVGRVDSMLAPVTTKSSATIAMADLEPDSIARHAKFQLVQFKDASCNTWSAYFLMTDPE